MENYRTNIILNKTIKFSLDIIRYCDLLESERKYVIAKFPFDNSLKAQINEIGLISIKLFQVQRKVNLITSYYIGTLVNWYIEKIKKRWH